MVDNRHSVGPDAAHGCNDGVPGFVVRGSDAVPPPGFRAFHFTWQTATNSLEEVGLKTFRTAGITYQFKSKSGGEILNSALLARKIAYLVYVNLELNEACRCKAVQPRMNSVLLVTNATDEQIADVLKVTDLFGGIQRRGGVRPDQQLAEESNV
jgi:hypothetical protein